jgi:hypothetical protein
MIYVWAFLPTEFKRSERVIFPISDSKPRYWRRSFCALCDHESERIIELIPLIMVIPFFQNDLYWFLYVSCNAFIWAPKMALFIQEKVPFPESTGQQLSYVFDTATVGQSVAKFVPWVARNGNCGSSLDRGRFWVITRCRSHETWALPCLTLMILQRNW